MNNLFFDLDGTLVNSEKGIMKGLKYMYEHTLGYVPHDDATLRKFIGPTFSYSFKKYDNIEVNDPIAKERMKSFREYYDVEGWKELTVIDGVYEMLEQLKDSGKEIFVATSKPEVHAKNIVEHFGMKPYIRHVFGASDDEVTRSLKEDVISYGMEKTSVDLNSDNLVMVGDRSSDVIGAHKNNLKAIGVTYGFGDKNELSQASSDWIVNKPLEIAKIALEN
ncbi:HAD hydrolase-like protein [Companilactobacillus furfuricola]|uniref:HAD hydrolase-like protein n=1 Tax=Companilactobacillus furfuricola TaxID=1462575 RepID=UPI000F79A643|nr:HAD hydrolase-like protein [Companilactobacillus furfuricola]